MLACLEGFQTDHRNLFSIAWHLKDQSNIYLSYPGLQNSVMFGTYVSYGVNISMLYLTYWFQL